MKRAELIFARPLELQATAPAEARGVPRDQARLLVSTAADKHEHAHFYDLARFLNPGDLLVVNDSATLPASLPASGRIGEFIVNFATDFGQGTWLVEPRWSSSQPGPLPLAAGEEIVVGGLKTRLAATYPGLPRLWFAQVDGDVRAAMNRVGAPIRYGYVTQPYPLSTYQTVFAKNPGSAEMPSAAYPFTERVVNDLRARGVEIAPITLHTGVSSLEVEAEVVEEHPLYPEPFIVSAATAKAVNDARRDGRRVIATGTTVVRALESAWNGSEITPHNAFTRLYIHPARGVHVIDGLITGLHDPVTSHLAMLYTIGGQDLIRAAYAEAVTGGYLWHEFGDSHLILPERSPQERRWIAVSRN
ncbi:MAG TPA: S-adenosylmethionine:tRNA ribosyltransferase-isomerase [Phototrophicaceae bacterium]|nr:S-adenosylmethionine:tRNA ribosyltransferase-isomerase [Phototrophicaceae bacterium]